MRNPKFVFVTGGVMSGIGKGITTASIAKLMQFRGFKVSCMKIDPYLNVDPGTLNPVEHGECFVTDEVWNFNPINDPNLNPFTSTRIAELDQDFGTYERFLGEPIHPSHNITSGQIYFETILKERKGSYLGKTVQIIPHCTDMIKDRIKQTAESENLDVLIIECGGTVGDIESEVFLEAFRMMRLELPRQDTALVHVTVVPYSKAVGELKSKPTQHSVKALQSVGLQPDFLICRSEIKITPEIKRKISIFSNIAQNNVISNPDLVSIYSLPIVLEQQNLGDLMGELLSLKSRLVERNTFADWKRTAELYTQTHSITLKIALPGKYVDNKDSYVSINEALKHATANEKVNLEIVFIDTEQSNYREKLQECDGILLTPGFGSRGVEGMIDSATFALETKKPYLGICFGAQLFYVAFMRKYMGITEAHSAEIDEGTGKHVVDLMEEQQKVMSKGGTMRLGGHDVFIKTNTKLFDAYGKSNIHERFRHRYHIMDDYYTSEVEEKGLIISAYDKSGKIINAIEMNGDHWMVGVQFHPEYTSRPWAPSPIYQQFIREIIKRKQT